MINRSKPMFSILLILALLACGCGSDDTVTPDPPVAHPALQLSLASETIDVDSEVLLTISFQDIDNSVFAVGFRIGFEQSLVGVSEDTSFSAGDYFGDEAVSLFQVNEGLMYLSCSGVASAEKAWSSGQIGTVSIQGLSAGQCDFTIALDHLVFIDSTGAEVEIPDLTVTDTSLVVQ